eukprot:TRINITY_DN14869_c0_g1_i1.p1 TRINITY_DN14869_c0_g1~~TRINITY_DN14869_c0_g1_i1.p1  ORF type:complete len:1167 (-),score=140.02 TRINITY_DN14869_c0_g1_i1:30-3509(-)
MTELFNSRVPAPPSASHALPTRSGAEGVRLIRAHPPVQVAPKVSEALSSDSSHAGDEEIPDEFDAVGDFGRARCASNLGNLEPIQSLAHGHAHNANLVRQFGELAQTFGAWRPVRGDGNCYYRAVLYAWLERSFALGTLSAVQHVAVALKAYVNTQGIAASARLCRRLLKTWIRRRSQCVTENEVLLLCRDLSAEFGKVNSDRAFILCLRYLIAEYLLKHAHEPVSAGENALTYDAWAASFEDAKDIRDYCEQQVFVMDRDAADLVQHVCPRVLQTVVRICMVDRETAHCNFIDYGEGAGAPVRSSSAVPSSGAASLHSAAALAYSSGECGMQPEIYLLLKPGHYDILVLQGDAVCRIMQDTSVVSSATTGLHARPVPRHLGVGGGETQLKQHVDLRWQSLLRLTHDVEDRFRAALRCLEDKVKDELEARRKRLGSIDESLFEGQLTSVLDPLRDALARLRQVPDDSPFSQDKHFVADPRQADSLGNLLPSLAAVLRQGRPQVQLSARAPTVVSSLAKPRAKIQALNPLGYAPQVRPRLMQEIPPQRPPQRQVQVPVEVQALPVVPARAPLPSPLKAEQAAPVTVPPAQAAAAVSSVQPAAAMPVASLSAQPPLAAASVECCYCLQPGALALAQCGCAYHITCLREHVAGELEHASNPACHIHDRAYCEDFLSQHVPDLLPMRNAAVAQPSPSEHAPAVSSAKVLSDVGTPLVTRPVALDPIVESVPPPRPGIPSSSMFQTPVQSLGLTPTPSSPSGSALKKVPASMRRLPQTGNLGAALGVPCVICFGEDGVLKTLHCGYKAHSACLKNFWSEKVLTLCRLTDIRCPAEVAGCSLDLNEADLRGVVDAADIAEASRSIEDVDAQNQVLIDELKKQCEEYRPMFQCAICLTEHEVEGCCTLPCQHRFCFESLQYHFDIIVRERRLNKLTCPVDGCGHNLRTEDSIHIFQQCLSEESYNKLLEFLTRDDPHIYECKARGCEEKVFLDDGDDFSDLACPRGHRFCGSCELGPHPGLSCEAQQERKDKERKAEEVQRDQESAWADAMQMGWKPCPRRCAFGGGFKAEEECDHVTCECGFEFCWDCGVERKVLLEHDNRWHKPSCRYHTPIAEVSEPPNHRPNCPECAKLPRGSPCSFPPDDGYPHSYVRRRRATQPSVRAAH